MNYSIVGTGNVGRTLASFFAKAGVEVAIANKREPKAVEPIAKQLGGKIIASSLDQALDCDVIFFAVQFLSFKDVGSAKPDWTGKIVVDVTNAAFLCIQSWDHSVPTGAAMGATSAGSFAGLIGAKGVTIFS